MSAGKKRILYKSAVRALSCVMLLLAVTAVSIVPGASSEPVAIDQIEWDRMLIERGVKTPGLPYPLEINDALRDAAASAVTAHDPLGRLEALQRYLFDKDAFHFDYEARNTLTAAQAFESRGGNCVSFTNMFIAMGRSLGIPVQAALAYGEEGSERLGDLVVVNSHVVAAYRHAKGRTIYDFQRRRETVLVGYRLLDDYWLMAIYVNNHGVELILDGDLDGAQGYFRDAIALAPDFVDAYNNLGVTQRRLGNPEAALDTYLLALDLEPSNRSIQNNLRPLFALMAENRGDGEPGGGSGEYFRTMARGDDELSHGAAANAKKHYRRARRLEPGRAEPYVAMARMHLFRGQIASAKKQLRLAIEIDPDNLEAQRLLNGLSGKDAQRDSSRQGNPT